MNIMGGSFTNIMLHEMFMNIVGRHGLHEMFMLWGAAGTGAAGAGAAGAGLFGGMMGGPGLFGGM